MARAFICIQVLFNWAARLSAVEMGRVYLYLPFYNLGALVVEAHKLLQ